MMIRGATYEIEITIKDDNGTAVDLTSATGILVALYGNGNRIIDKWSLNDKSADGFGDVTITSAINGIISVALSVNESLQALEKMANVEVVVSFSNPLFEGNLQVCIDTDIALEEVKRSIFEGVTPI
jgi:hypothetical protein